MANERKQRLKEIQNVLAITFLMNLTVCLIKIILGFITGILTISADGFHSLGDSLSNIVGFLGIRLARKEPDDKHPYGYDKFESMATLVIAALISITCYKVFESGIDRLFNPHWAQANYIVILAMIGSMVINILTIVYEGGAGRRLKSELLIADSNETKSDLFVSGAVIAVIILINQTGWLWLDGTLTIGIGLLILKIIYDIFRSTAKILADAQVVDPAIVVQVIMNVPDVKFCHAIRSRGREEGFFLDCHLGVNRNITIEKAHDDVCHRVKKALHEKFPGLRSANIHLEPDNDHGLTRANSVFRKRDSYDHDSK
jgi:cation diffusion facilitator family transporter